MSKADIAALLERVRAATGPDREIDGEIAKLCGWLKTPLDWIDNLGRKRNLPPAFTASLDASVALIERELPGWMWRVATCSVSDDAWVIPDFNHPEHGARFLKELAMPDGSDPASYWQEVTDVDRRPAGHPALALCQAFLATKLSLSDHSQT